MLSHFGLSTTLATIPQRFRFSHHTHVRRYPRVPILAIVPLFLSPQRFYLTRLSICLWNILDCILSHFCLLSFLPRITHMSSSLTIPHDRPFCQLSYNFVKSHLTYNLDTTCVTLVFPTCTKSTDYTSILYSDSTDCTTILQPLSLYI